MMKNNLFVLLIFLLSAGCTTLHQDSEEQKQVYVFDEVPEDKTIDVPKTGEFPNIKETYYVVQVGAYTTEEKANSFAEMSRIKTNYKFSVVYSESLKLHLVQVIPFFKSRTEAETVRNNLWKITEFVDAWILTVNK